MLGPELKLLKSKKTKLIMVKKKYFEMIRPLYFFLFTVIAFQSCTTNTKQVLITGKIQDSSPSQFEYTVPENGVNYFGFKELVKPDSSGNFKISLQIENPCFVEFMKEFRGYGSLIVEPGMKYDVSINTSDKEHPFNVNCKNAEGQLLYNKLKYRSMAGGHFELEARYYIKSHNSDSIIKAIKSKKEAESDGFKKLLEKKVVSDHFFNLVKTDREYYYSGETGSVAFINYLMQPRGMNYLNKQQYKKMWKDVFTEHSPSDSRLLTSPWFFYYIQNYLRYLEMIIDSTDTKTLTDYHNRGIIHTHYIDYAKKHLNDADFEYYCAAYIYYEAASHNYEKELVGIFEQFKKDFPKSRYTKYLESLIKEIIEFHKKAEVKPEGDYVFFPDYEKMNSLNESLKSFRGKQVFIDIWATWCSPCKSEFKYTKELRALLESRNISILYISIDRESSKQQWKEMISFYDLKGTHLLANEKLVKDLSDLFGSKGEIAIPWYMLVDKNGKIIIKHAKFPSEMPALEKQLKDLNK